jgi:hypothetical protein
LFEVLACVILAIRQWTDLNPRTDEDIARILLTQADAHFAGWLVCPVFKKETRHYTKDTHDSSVSKMRRIWCEDCHVVQMQFKQSSGKWA